MRIETDSAAGTEAAGGDLAGRLAPGDVVAVQGELGSGKTTFVRGACRALGVVEPVTSPTFAIGQVYEGGSGSGPVEIAHLDLHRVASLGSEDPALLADYLTPERIAFVERPEVAMPVLGAPAAAVRIAHAGGDRRLIVIA